MVDVGAATHAGNLTVAVTDGESTNGRPQRVVLPKQAKDGLQRPKLNQNLAQSQKKPSVSQVSILKRNDSRVSYVDLGKDTAHELEARKEQEAAILKIMSKKQNEIWENYKAGKANAEDLLNQHVYQRSEDDIAHISNILRMGLAESVSIKKPPDIKQNDGSNSLLLQERESSAGNGVRIRFWLDPWLPGKPPLIDFPGVSVPIWEREYTVSNYSTNGAWRWDLLEAYLPQEIINILAAMMPPVMDQDADSVAWSRETNGEFSIPSAIAIL
ncbi:hypothetical protein RIF29_00747 [Crotalaria pallida]|uniref:Uncharacterized protein n=1 Tax=Crotalaria pallida TaxID=3830 RepID=A0AAN9IW69_CROPI